MDAKLQFITIIGIAIMLIILLAATKHSEKSINPNEEHHDDESPYTDDISDYYEDNSEAEMVYEASQKSFRLNNMQMDAFNKMSTAAKKHSNPYDD